MTEVCGRMLNDEEEDSPEKCRERRRRRIEMRRLAAAGSPESPKETGTESSGGGGGDGAAEDKRIGTEEETRDSPTVPKTEPAGGSSGDDVKPSKKVAVAEETCQAEVVEPVFGTISVSGRPREMEDALAVRTKLCCPEINGRRPVHFFAVYDGHGGSHVATLCGELMHVLLAEELMRVEFPVYNESGYGSTGSSGGIGGGGYGGDEWKECWRKVIKRSFERMDELVLNTCACGSFGFKCGCHPMELALAGSTAVFAVLTAEHIVVANCGDSRAVLCRGGRAVPLSFDHKPDRSDELARIEAAGGRVIFVNGARVEGILAMSRALGDKYLKPTVISEPEISFTKRQPEDECLILATDGLWDVLSSDLACQVACECLREEIPPVGANAGLHMEDEGDGALYPSRSMLAAALLTRLALGRRSSDNISVIVVDLKRS